MNKVENENHCDAEECQYLMLILWVLNPNRGSSTKLVAKSSVSHSSFTLILGNQSIVSHHQHAERFKFQIMSLITSMCSEVLTLSTDWAMYVLALVGLD